MAGFSATMATPATILRGKILVEVLTHRPTRNAGSPFSSPFLLPSCQAVPCPPTPHKPIAATKLTTAWTFNRPHPSQIIATPSSLITPFSIGAAIPTTSTNRSQHTFAHSSSATAQQISHTYTHTHPIQPFSPSCSPLPRVVLIGSFNSHTSPSAPAQYAFSSETGGSAGGGGGGGKLTGGNGKPEEGGEGDNGQNISKEPIVDGMTRYPELSVRGMLRTLDYFGTLVFASSGTLTAGMAGMDLLGCVLVGTITAIGGGTVRDILLGKGAFWLDETEYVLMSVVTALLTFYFWPREGQTGRPVDDTEFLFWSDTLGVGAFCVIGAQNGIRAGLHPVICAMCGMFTATFGGLIRDVLCARPVRILHSKQEIYATTALAGGSVYTLLRMAGMPLSARIIGGFATAVALRYFAWNHNIRLPTFNSPEPDRSA